MKNLVNLVGRFYLVFMALLYSGYFVMEFLGVDLYYDYSLAFDNDDLLMCGGMMGFVLSILFMIMVVTIEEFKIKRINKLHWKEVRKEIKEMNDKEKAE